MTAVAFCAVASNLPMWFQRLAGSSSSKGHPAHVSSLSGPGTGPGMPPVIRERPYVEGPVILSWLSCRLSAAAVCFLAVLSRHGCPLSLRSAYRWLVFSTGPVTGFPCSALVRCGRCRAPPIPRDRGALVADIETSATTAASQRRVLFFGGASISRSSG